MRPTEFWKNCQRHWKYVSPETAWWWIWRRRRSSLVSLLRNRYFHGFQRFLHKMFWKRCLLDITFDKMNLRREKIYFWGRQNNVKRWLWLLQQRWYGLCPVRGGGNHNNNGGGGGDGNGCGCLIAIAVVVVLILIVLGGWINPCRWNTGFPCGDFLNPLVESNGLW